MFTPWSVVFIHAAAVSIVTRTRVSPVALPDPPGPGCVVVVVGAVVVVVEAVVVVVDPVVLVVVGAAVVEVVAEAVVGVGVVGVGSHAVLSRSTAPAATVQTARRRAGTSAVDRVTPRGLLGLVPREVEVGDRPRLSPFDSGESAHS
jgi:hypothetical protein